jgi:hypothetical protein
MPNVELLHRTLAHVEEHQDLWDQRHWASHTPCGTAYCFAGTALMLAGKADFTWCSRAYDGLEYAEQMADGEDIDTAARELLGLDLLDGDALFAPQNTLDQLRELVAKFTTEEQL